MKDHFLNCLRNRQLPIAEFRRASASLSQSMAEEISKQISVDQNIILIAILRAGLVLLPAFQEKYINAPIGLVGIQRDERTAFPHLYYEKIPLLSPTAHLLVLDPMLATGGSANLALNLLKKRGARTITLISVIAAPQGVEKIQKEHPSVSRYIVAVDDGLDSKKFIVPGLGDFGDRYFGTH